MSRQNYESRLQLTESVSASNEGNRLGIVHAHTAKRCANVQSRSQWVRDTVRPNRVHINQAHVGARQGNLKTVGPRIDIGATIVSLVVAFGEPLGLRAPVDALICLPGIDSATTVAQGREVEGLQGHVSGEDDQVGPRKLAAILLLDGPYETAGFVETGIVGPAAQRCETLLSLTGHR